MKIISILLLSCLSVSAQVVYSPFAGSGQFQPIPTTTTITGTGAFTQTTVTQSYYNTNYVVLTNFGDVNVNVLYQWNTNGFFTNTANNCWIIQSGSLMRVFDNGVSSYKSPIPFYLYDSVNFPFATWNIQGGATAPAGTGTYLLTNVVTTNYYQTNSATTPGPTVFANGISGSYLNLGFGNTIAAVGNNIPNGGYFFTNSLVFTILPSSIVSSANVSDMGNGNFTAASGGAQSITNDFATTVTGVIASSGITNHIPGGHVLIAAAEQSTFNNSSGVQANLALFNGTNNSSGQSVLFAAAQNSTVGSLANYLSAFSLYQSTVNVNKGVVAGSGVLANGTNIYSHGDGITITNGYGIYNLGSNNASTNGVNIGMVGSGFTNPSNGSWNTGVTNANLSQSGTNNQFTGNVLGTSFATQNTNQFTIAASGWTNTNSFNCVAYVVPTAATITYSDGTNTIGTYTSVTSVGPIPFVMHPSYKVTAASGLAGKAVAQ